LRYNFITKVWTRHALHLPQPLCYNARAMVRRQSGVHRMRPARSEEERRMRLFGSTKAQRAPEGSRFGRDLTLEGPISAGARQAGQQERM
jgi:hypothetical protein